MSNLPPPVALPALADPLADQTLLLSLQIAPGPVRDARPLLLAFGVEGEAPVLQQGTLADLPTLLQQAWQAYHVRCLARPATPTPPAELPESDGETVEDAPVEIAAESVVDSPPATPPVSPAAEEANVPATRPPAPVLPSPTATTRQALFDLF